MPKKEVQEEKPKKAGVAATVRALESRFNKLVSRLEKQFGIDLSGDGKIGASKVMVLVAVAVIGCAVAMSLSARELWTLKDADGTKVVSFETGDANDASLMVSGTVTAQQVVASGTAQADGASFKRVFKDTLTTAEFAVGSNALTSIVLPDNFVIDYVVLDVISAVQSTNAGNTISIGLESDVDALKLTTTGSISAAVTACIPVGTAGSSVKTGAQTSPYINVGVGSATNASAVIHIEGFISE